MWILGLKGLIMMVLITMMALTQSSLFHDRHHYKLRYISPWIPFSHINKQTYRAKKETIVTWIKTFSKSSWLMCISRLVPKTCGREKVSKVSKLFKNQDCTTKIWRNPKNSYYMQHYLPRAVIKRRGPGIPPATMNIAPSYFQRKIKEK